MDFFWEKKRKLDGIGFGWIRVDGFEWGWIWLDGGRLVKKKWIVCLCKWLDGVGTVLELGGFVW